MPERHKALIGKKLPDVGLAEYVDGDLLSLTTHAAIGRGRVLVAGVPGAFTPVCSGQHVPTLLANLPALERRFDQIICVVTSDPFTLRAWTAIIDPLHHLRFLSDGNLALAQALNLVSNMPSFFLGQRSERYMLVVEEGVIRHATVESSILDFQCTRPDSALLYV